MFVALRWYGRDQTIVLAYRKIVERFGVIVDYNIQDRALDNKYLVSLKICWKHTSTFRVQCNRRGNRDSRQGFRREGFGRRQEFGSREHLSR